ncbi:MAG: hypothetical protein II635_04820, partial [Oscillospiraceae bacterium]|nr:hypothetical protein [Oscillospiraceae bacterium]
DGRQPICASRNKNPAKITRCEVPCSFDGAVFRQVEEGTADNTCCIIKAADEDLAEKGPSKPCSYRYRQLTVILPNRGEKSNTNKRECPKFSHSRRETNNPTNIAFAGDKLVRRWYYID